jgi:hypothetical protein
MPHDLALLHGRLYQRQDVDVSGSIRRCWLGHSPATSTAARRPAAAAASETRQSPLQPSTQLANHGITVPEQLHVKLMWLPHYIPDCDHS